LFRLGLILTIFYHHLLVYTPLFCPKPNHMRILIFGLMLLASSLTLQAQSPVGVWKMISHMVEYGGEKMDSHASLLAQRPCAAKIVYEIKADGNFRLNASASTCDEKYRNIQEKLYAQTKWKLENGIFSTSSTNFAVGQSYKISFSGDKMTWIGTEGQGVIVYQKQ
jgi:hypothetical protein